MAGSLQSKTAIVTGSSRGIGKAIALRLAEEGADVAVNYVAHEADAQRVAAQVRALGRRSLLIRADISRPDEIERLFREVAREWNSLDIYVNNAIDVAAYGPVSRLKLDAWRHTIDSHATTFLQAAQLAVPLMASAGGAIVALSSLGSRTCIQDYAAVGVGKAAVEALTRYLAVELAPRGIRVNAVCGGPIDTAALRALRHYGDIERLAQEGPGGRIGTPEDLADIVTFLCTERARWIVGQTIVADGGQSIASASRATVRV